jgi:hypothetical protein
MVLRKEYFMSSAGSAVPISGREIVRNGDEGVKGREGVNYGS